MKEYVVGPEHLPIALKRYGVAVLSTPSMISMMECTSWECAQRFLSDGYSTVGAKICVRHRAPAPVGSRVKVLSRVEEVEGRKLVFRVEAWLGDVLVGEGTHERFVVNLEKFKRKIEEIARKSSSTRLGRGGAEEA